LTQHKKGLVIIEDPSIRPGGKDRTFEDANAAGDALQNLPATAASAPFFDNGTAKPGKAGLI
jgi:hypothetical protein